MDKYNDIQDEKELEIDENKKETPLSVRVEAYYKDLFLQLSEQPGYNRKRLLEAMISSYVKKEREEKRNNNLSLDHEISLISSSLEDILKVFKTISVKAQDTIGSNKGFYEQQIENLKKNINTLELRIQEFEEDKRKIAIEEKEVNLRLKETVEENNKLRDGAQKLQDELKKAKEEQGKVQNELYNLRRIEAENIRLMAENKELLKEIENLNDVISGKDKAAERMNYDYEVLERKKEREIEILKRDRKSVV